MLDRADHYRGLFQRWCGQRWKRAIRPPTISAIVMIAMDTILKLAVLIAICGGGAVAISVGLQLVVRRAPGEKQ